MHLHSLHVDSNQHEEGKGIKAHVNASLLADEFACTAALVGPARWLQIITYTLLLCLPK